MPILRRTPLQLQRQWQQKFCCSHSHGSCPASSFQKFAFLAPSNSPNYIFLHVAQFGDNEIAFPRNNRPAEFRRFLGEHNVKPKNFLFGLLRWEEEAYNSRKRFVSIMKKTSQTHLVVDTLIATVTFTAGITMPGGFIGQEGPHSGSPVLMRNTAFKAFIITNTTAMVQSCSAAFFHLFMPLLFDEKNLGDFSFLLASLAFFASISSMGTMMVAFVLGTYAVLMHSWGLAVANSVIGLFYFIPVFFICIGSLNYFLEISSVGSFWILGRLYFLCPNCTSFIDCYVLGTTAGEPAQYPETVANLVQLFQLLHPHALINFSNRSL